MDRPGILLTLATGAVTPGFPARWPPACRVSRRIKRQAPNFDHKRRPEPLRRRAGG